MSDRLGASRLLLGGQFAPGDLTLAGSRLGDAVAPDSSGLLAVPGFVDLQVNGIGRVEFASASPDDYLIADRALLASGVTAYQPTFVTLPWDRYAPALATAAAARASIGHWVIGVHAEGPFLGPGWAGAHDAALLLAPDRHRVAALLAPGVVTQVTIAPELPGAIEAIRTLRRAGVTVAIGHTDADTGVVRAAVDAGASVLTHVFNAHRRWSHRSPGPAGVALDDPRLSPTVIADGHHLDPATLRLVFAAAGGRTALISDSVATGSGRLAGQAVTVGEGRATIADGRLAGSVLTMDAAVRAAVDAGIAPAAALAAASTIPARLIGRQATLETGAPADVTLLDRNLAVVRVYRAGRCVWSA